MKHTYKCNFFSWIWSLSTGNFLISPVFQESERIENQRRNFLQIWYVFSIQVLYAVYQFWKIMFTKIVLEIDFYYWFQPIIMQLFHDPFHLNQNHIQMSFICSRDHFQSSSISIFHFVIVICSWSCLSSMTFSAHF